MSISIEPSFLNGEEWLEAVGSSFIIQLVAPVDASGSVPEFPVVVVIGITGLVLLKRRCMVKV
jgi:hypothetical protein